MRWHDKYAFTRRWKLRLHPWVCRAIGHRPVERYEEEKFDIGNLGRMELVRFCRRCRKTLPLSTKDTGQ